MPPRPDQQWQGWYLDGRTPQRHPVVVRVFSDGLTIIFPEAASRRWPYDRIRQTQGAEAGQPVRLESGSDPPEILIVPDQGILPAIRDMAAGGRRRFHVSARWRMWVAATAATGLALILLVWVLYAWGIPAFADIVAARVPVAWEAQLGAAVTDTLAPPGQRCSRGGPHVALEQILSRLTAAGPPTPYAYTIIVSTDDAPNAFAAPGGYVVVTAGLLRLSDRPEEIAGVMAHELQHIIQRHATRLLVQELSLRALVSLASGDLGGLGSALEVARGLGRLRYQRADEMSADREAVHLLVSARIDPRALTTLLRKLQQTPAAAFQSPAYLSTHPSLDERLAVLDRLAAETPVELVPLLPDSPWSEIAHSCD